MQLNDAIKTYYDEWYNDAPASYKQGVLLNAAPIAICIKYGQNRLICVGEDDQADAQFWKHEFDLSKIARVSLAFAVHYL